MTDDTPIFEATWRALHPPIPGGRHRWLEETPPPLPEESSPVTTTQPQPPYIRFPRSAQPTSFTPRQVAQAYNAPVDQYDGSGTTVGLIELGGGYNTSDMSRAGLPDNVTVVSVDGGRSRSDGPNGADGEVMLDVEVVAAVAPGAAIRVYFAPNSDQGFIDAAAQAAAECDTVSISWGGPENSWSSSSINAFSAVLANARAAGVPVFVAAGDAGSTDGTRRNVTDYPASDPSVIGCGGTRLTVDGNGQRSSEVVWNDDPTQSATGGGVSKVFAGRQVPDVAGNADPDSGYEIAVDGDTYVIGGTSAVAPLYAGAYVLLLQGHGSRFDFLNLCLTNPSAMFDVTVGNNGGYKAGPGRDNVSGLGVADFGKLLAILQSGTQVPAPGGDPTGGGTTAPPTTTTPPSGGGTSTELPGCTAFLGSIGDQISKFLGTS